MVVELSFNAQPNAGAIMKFVKLLTATILVSATSPAYADKIFAVTPSGTTEMLFGQAPATVVSKIGSRCMDVKWVVISSTPTEVTCESPMNTGQAMLGQMLLGNSYSTPPRRYFRFNVTEMNGISRVQAAGWMELQMAFGQTKRTDFTGPEFHNSIMTFLSGAGGKLPVGTTFPNHVVVGFDSDQVPYGRHQVPQIKSIVPGAAGERAGLQVGDLVVSIAGERLKSENDFLDALAEAAERPAYEIQVVRGGKTLKLTVERAFRPAWSEAVVAEQTASVASSPVAGTNSVADELAKLAKLKSDGLLTDAEFEGQKKKLLGLQSDPAK